MMLTPSSACNCRPWAETRGDITCYRMQVTDPNAPQQDAGLNANTQTDQASTLAWFTLPAGEARDITAVYQHKSWWLRPGFPKALGEVPRRSQLVLWRKDGEYAALLAVCSHAYRGDLEGTPEGIRVSVSANGCPGDDSAPVVCCAGQGPDPYRLTEALVQAALESQGRLHTLRKNKTFPRMFEYFGWCTWDAFYHKVNEKDILAKLEEFRQKDVPLGWLLIDDGWSDADYETKRLNSLGAAPEKFPQGIGHTARVAKEQYGLHQVGVWHALMGYWAGLNPGTPLFRQWEPRLMARGEDYVLIPQEETVYDFMSQWHSRLAREDAVDFIKVDGQGSASIYYKGAADYRHTAEYLRGLERSAHDHMGDNLINCMGMAPQCMWLRETSSLSRSSDDFVPQVPHGFREHILQNSFNSLLQGQFYWGDWDMFWSDHGENFQNSVARSVSGGPVYCSDPLGKTDPAAIRPLISRDGRVNRCDGVGLPTLDCLLSDPLTREGLFKIFNPRGAGYALAAFHISSREHTITDKLETWQIPGLAEGEWLVYRYFGRKLEVLTQAAGISLTLAPNQAEHLLVLPRQPHGQFIGDPGKYLCDCTVLEQHATRECLTGTLTASPKILFRADTAPRAVLVEGQPVAFAPGDGFYEIAWEGTGRIHIQVLF